MMGTEINLDKTHYSAAEVANIFGLHYITIIKKLQTGKVKGVKFGKNWNVSREEITRLLEEGIP